MWWVHTRLDTADWPGRRQVLQFQFAALPQRYWVVVELGVPSVCRTDPGFEVDVTVTADLSALYQVWLGRLPLRQALRAGTVAFEGPAPLTRRMPTTLLLSPIATRAAAVG
jgi:putative sterol carrier protein